LNCSHKGKLFEAKAVCKPKLSRNVILPLRITLWIRILGLICTVFVFSCAGLQPAPVPPPASVPVPEPAAKAEAEPALPPEKTAPTFTEPEPVPKTEAEPIVPPEEISRTFTEAENVLLSLKNRNHTLETFKGIGNIRLWDKEKKIRVARAAWSGAETGKLRIEILDTAGQPAASIASDGEWLYYRSLQTFYKKRSDDPDLKKIVSLPVTAGDVIALLSGRIPVRPYDSILLEKEDSGGYVLALEKTSGDTEKIYLDESKTVIRKTVITDASGTMLYQTEFDRVKEVENYQIPFQLIFSNHEGDGFRLSVERYWANVPVPLSNFVLTPPEPRNQERNSER